MIFDLVRLVLVSRDQTSLFEKRRDDRLAFDREGWIRHILGREFRFVYRNVAYTYQPQGDEGHYITAKIGRPRTAVENAPPEQGFDKIQKEQWFVSAVIIDPTSHTDGQKVAFEHALKVGQSAGIMRAVFEDANLEADSPFIVEANAITDPQDFWTFEKENRGNIVSASFEFVAPNMFGIRDAIDREMVELRDNEKAVSATLTLKNENGLNLNTPRVAQTLGYVTEGGGSVQARTRKKKVFRSQDKAKRIDLPTVKEIEFKTFSGMIGEVINRIFGDE